MIESIDGELPREVGVVLGDPRLPCAYTVEKGLGEEWTRARAELEATLDGLPGIDFVYFDDHESLVDTLRARPPGLVLNLCDMGYRNQWELESAIPACLDMLGIPYTGADPAAMAISADKALVSLAASRLGIAVPNETFIDLTADPLVMPTAYPAMIKPNASGGSFGIVEDCVVHDAAEAEAYLRWLAGELERPEAIAQDFLTGREFSVGLIGNPDTGLTALPPIEIDYSQLDPELVPIQTYGWKADPESPYLGQVALRQAELDEVTRSQLIDGASKLVKRLAIRDYCRIDFRCGEDGVPRLLDVNTNPSWYYDGKLAMMAGWAGIDYARMIGMILEAAWHRTRHRSGHP